MWRRPSTLQVVENTFAFQVRAPAPQARRHLFVAFGGSADVEVFAGCYQVSLPCFDDEMHEFVFGFEDRHHQALLSADIQHRRHVGARISRPAYAACTGKLMLHNVPATDA